MIEGAITERTRALLPVHFGGLPSDLDKIYTIARRHNLAVIEDAAHAFPAKYKNRFIGSTKSTDSPSAICFSFYATKTITTGEGGMICTDNKSLAERCRIMSLHGISKDAWRRYTREGSWYYEIIAPGFKYNMTDIAAAMGLAQLRKANKMWQRRRKIAMHYNSAFGSLPEVQIPPDQDDCEHAWHLYVLRLNKERLSISRNSFIKELNQLNIGTSVHFIPLQIHPYYQNKYKFKPNDFPVAYREYQRVISLPIYSKMSDGDVEDVVQTVTEIIRLHKIA